VIPVLKADAYGHGMIPMAKALFHRGHCEMIAVATLEEGLELRKTIPRGLAILVLSGFMPHLLEAFVKYRLTAVIHSLPHLKTLVGRKNIPDIHLKIDTGMHRLGIQPDQIPEAIKQLEKMQLKLSGVMTHFAESESLLSDFTDQQLALFEKCFDQLKEKKLIQTDARIHVANSGGVLREKLGFSNAVRPGLALFGISPNTRIKTSEDLIPVLSWKSRVLTIKEIPPGETIGYGRTYTTTKKEKIALISVGYADGYPRLLSNQGFVLIQGRKCPLRGRVSMDLIAVDVSAIPNPKEGMNVTLIGQDGKQEVQAWDIALMAETIPYEILCGLSARVPKIYID